MSSIESMLLEGLGRNWIWPPGRPQTHHGTAQHVPQRTPVIGQVVLVGVEGAKEG